MPNSMANKTTKREVHMEKISLFIVDDSPGLRNIIKEILEKDPDMKIAGEAADGLEAVTNIKSSNPDLVLMDIWMPKMNGLAATRQLKQEMPELKIIVLTIFDSPEYREAARKSGANGFLRKSSIVKDLIPTIRKTIASN